MKPKTRSLIKNDNSKREDLSRALLIGLLSSSREKSYDFRIERQLLFTMGNKVKPED